jgi:membrane protein DedA with SNARE-associated domain
VFLGVFLENTGLPVPGETALLAGAALAHFGELSLPRVILVAMCAAILGDNLGFLVGRRGGRRFIERFCGRIGLTPERLQQFDAFFHRHGPRTVFIARFITGLRVFGAVLAGASRMRWRDFLLYNALGAIVWCTVIGLVGFTLGRSWEALEKWIGRTGLVGLAAVIAVIVIGIARSRRAVT